MQLTAHLVKLKALENAMLKLIVTLDSLLLRTICAKFVHPIVSHAQLVIIAMFVILATF